MSEALILAFINPQYDNRLYVLCRNTSSVVMSSSWNFPARASPSYEGSEPSWGTLIFELKPSWQFRQYVKKLQISSKF